MKKLLFFIITANMVAVLMCGIDGCSGKTDITGIWKGELTMLTKGYMDKEPKQETSTIELMLAQTDKNISGKITFDGNSLTIESGVIVDKTISFKAGVLEFNATVNGNSMDGTLKANFYTYDKGQVDISGTFKAKK